MTAPLTSNQCYYNEHDPKAAAWLRELIKAGAIAPGQVDERDIRDVRPSELEGFAQCHFFAGIGGWSYALRLAGWPDDRHVWTGSCPCQPFSTSGRHKRFADERHLWPAWFWLINAQRPAVVFGEQVASKAGLAWLDLVQADLESSLFAVEYADLSAASVGAPHRRQRLYWVGHSDSPRSQGRRQRWNSPDQRPAWEAELVNCRDGKRRPVEPGTQPLVDGLSGHVGLLRGYGNAIVPQVAAEFIQAWREAA